MMPFLGIFQSVLLLVAVSASTQNQAKNPADIAIDREGVLLEGKFYAKVEEPSRCGRFPAKARSSTRRDRPICPTPGESEQHVLPRPWDRRGVIDHAQRAWP